MSASEMRRRKMMPFFVGFMILYGRHSSVQWQGPWTCFIDAPRFAKSIGTKTDRLRQQLEWLRKRRYVSELDWGYGWVKVTMFPPVDRRTQVEEGAA
jgi:hypothetical protein